MSQDESVSSAVPDRPRESQARKSSAILPVAEGHRKNPPAPQGRMGLGGYSLQNVIHYRFLPWMRGSKEPLQLSHLHPRAFWCFCFKLSHCVRETPPSESRAIFF